MKDRVTRLLEALDAQIAALTRLQEALDGQRQQLVQRDTEGILRSIEAQSACLAQIEAEETRRLAAVRALQEAVGLSGPATLGELARHLPPDVQPLVLDKRATLKSQLEAVQRASQGNRRLMQRSLESIQEVMAAVTGRGPVRHTYESTGNLRCPERLQALLDRST